MNTTCLKSLILLVVLSLNIDIFPQSNNQLSIYLGPTISYRSLEHSSIIEHTMGVRYDVGMYFQRYLTQRFSIGIGLGFSRMGYNFPDYYYTLTTKSIDFIFYRDFLEIPLLSGYTVAKNDKNRLQLDLWFINQLYIGQEVKIKQNDNEDLEDTFEYKLSFDDIKDRNMDIYNVSLLLGTTFERIFGNNLSVLVSPFFKYGLLSLDNIHDWSLGLKLGLGYIL